MPRSKRDAMGLGPKPKEKTTLPKPEPKKVKVNIIESERGWGSKIDEVKEFDTLELAEAFVYEFNSHNKSQTAPDWYMRAEVIR